MSFFFVARMLVVFVALVTLMLSWRASLLLIVALGVDFFTVLGGALPGGANILLLGVVPLTLGFMLGALVSLGTRRMDRYDAAKLVLAVGIFLKLSWIDEDSWSAMSRAWPAQLVMLFSFPLGVLAGSLALGALLRRREARARPPAMPPP